MNKDKQKKWEKVLSDTYVANNLGLSEEAAKTKLIDSQFAIKQILDEKDNDDQLNAAKEVVKELNAGYSAAAKHEKAKIEFLLEVIEARRATKTVGSN